MFINLVKYAINTLLNSSTMLSKHQSHYKLCSPSINKTFLYQIHKLYVAYLLCCHIISGSISQTNTYTSTH